MTVKRCPKCELTKPVESFGWRNSAHTLRQSWCRRCLNRAGIASKNRQGRDGREHLRNHYEIGLTLCGMNADAQAVTSHYYDEPASSDLPACIGCVQIDEVACLDADRAQHQPRGPFDSNPYRSTYLATVERLNSQKVTA